MKVLGFILAFLSSYLLSAQQCYVFIGSYNKHNTNTGIYIYRLDTSSGKLTRASRVRNILNPAYLTISDDGHFVYACIKALVPGGGRVGSFSFNATNGTLAFINDEKSEGENPVYVVTHKSGKWLVNSNYTAGSVSVYPLDTNGKIGLPSQVITFSDSSINKERQDHAHIHASVFSPDNDFLFLPDLGADKIRCFRFDTSRPNPLQPISATLTIPGSGPRHFTFHPNNRYCYCVEEMSGTVSAYSYNGGKLELIQRIAAHEKTIPEGYHSADIHLSPDGLFLYASNRGRENNIAIFSVNQQNSTLTIVGYELTGGNHPRNFAIEPTGKFLLAANQISGDVVIFKRNATTGRLTRIGKKTKIRGASCIKIRYYPQ